MARGNTFLSLFFTFIAVFLSQVISATATAQPDAALNVLDRFGSFFGDFLIPSIPLSPSDGHSERKSEATDAEQQGLLGEAAAFAWGGSTLEVVKTQATYLTRAAAFGPRITSDEGLAGSLMPISLFYHPPANGSNDTTIVPKPHSNHACPYRGGPGWKHDENDHDGDGERYLGREEPDPDTDPKPPSDWIALVERGGGCAFAAKVRVAQALGAIAVVVGDAPSPDWGSEPGGAEDDPSEDSDPGLSSKRLITMYSPGDTSDIKTPSTFVTRPSYLDLTRLIEEVGREQAQRRKGLPWHLREEPQPMRGLEIVLGRDDMMWEWPLIDLALLLLLLPSFMTVTTVIIHRVRLIRQRRKDRAPELVVLGLPCLIWRSDGQPWEKVEGDAVESPDAAGGSSVPAGADLESGSNDADADEDNRPGPSNRRQRVMPARRLIQPPVPTRSHSFLPPGRSYYSVDECAICLSEFVDGDRVRVLPCGHIFHRHEIDDWLVRVRKLCPICKRDITVPIPPVPPAPALHSPPSASGQTPTFPPAEVEAEDGGIQPLLSIPLSLCEAATAAAAPGAGAGEQGRDETEREDGEALPVHGHAHGVERSNAEADERTPLLSP